MESTIVAAVVAAFVSTLGLIVQLMIARSNRRASKEQIEIKSLTEIKRQAYTNLSHLERKAEELRIYSWEIEGELISVMERGAGEGVEVQRVEDIIKLLDQFGKKADDFTNEWAEVRPDVPRGVEEYVRSLRHECLAEISLIKGLARILEKRPIDKKLVKNILNKLQYNRCKVDEFSQTIKGIRENIIRHNKKDTIDGK